MKLEFKLQAKLELKTDTNCARNVQKHFRFYISTKILRGKGVDFFFPGGGGTGGGGAKTLGGQIFTGGPLDSVFFPIFPKKIFACGGLKSMKSLGGGGSKKNPHDFSKTKKKTNH